MEAALCIFNGASNVLRVEASLRFEGATPAFGGEAFQDVDALSALCDNHVDVLGEPEVVGEDGAQELVFFNSFDWSVVDLQVGVPEEVIRGCGCYHGPRLVGIEGHLPSVRPGYDLVVLSLR